MTNGPESARFSTEEGTEIMKTSLLHDLPTERMYLWSALV